MNKWFDKTLLKFIIVGVVNTVVGMGIMFSMYNWVHCSYWFSSASNYIVTSVLSFFLNKHYTFQSNASGTKEAFRFGINIVLCYLIAYGIAKPFVYYLLQGMPKNWLENLAMAVGMCLFTGLNYIGQRFFTFKNYS